MSNPRESVVTVARETLDVYREAFHADAIPIPSELAIAEMCGRLAYCVEQLLDVEREAYARGRRHAVRQILTEVERLLTEVDR